MLKLITRRVIVLGEDVPPFEGAARRNAAAASAPVTRRRKRGTEAESLTPRKTP
jgi:hypothetical protein